MQNHSKENNDGHGNGNHSFNISQGNPTSGPSEVDDYIARLKLIRDQHVRQNISPQLPTSDFFGPPLPPNYELINPVTIGHNEFQTGFAQNTTEQQLPFQPPHYAIANSARPLHSFRMENKKNHEGFQAALPMNASVTILQSPRKRRSADMFTSSEQLFQEDACQSLKQFEPRMTTERSSNQNKQKRPQTIEDIRRNMDFLMSEPAMIVDSDYATMNFNDPIRNNSLDEILDHNGPMYHSLKARAAEYNKNQALFKESYFLKERADSARYAKACGEQPPAYSHQQDIVTKKGPAIGKDLFKPQIKEQLKKQNQNISTKAYDDYDELFVKNMLDICGDGAENAKQKELAYAPEPPMPTWTVNPSAKHEPNKIRDPFTSNGENFWEAALNMASAGDDEFEKSGVEEDEEMFG